LAIYIKRMRAGLIDPKGTPRVERDTPSVVVIDGCNALGQVCGLFAAEKVIEKARSSGVAAATVKRSQHFGAASYYGERIAKEGMIGIVFTNAEPAMPPWGGKEAFFGTNPISLVAPTGKGFPVRIDLATSVAARGRIIAAEKKGEAIPEGWAIDAEGNPTTDAREALAGAVLTMAGHKGYALALLVEVLCGVLSGAAVGRETGSMYKDLDRSQDIGHFLAALSIEHFLPRAEFLARMDAMIDALKSSPRRPDAQEILVPGELEHRGRLRRLSQGIEVGDEVVGELRQLARELAVTSGALEED